MSSTWPNNAPAPGESASPSRFDRQLGVDGFGTESQKSLGAATVLVAGIGGVGGTAALYLAAAGVGRLVLCHPGVAELPDLNRQVLLRADQVGEARVLNAARAISSRYPDVEVVALDEPVSGPSVQAWMSSCDVAVDCRHNFAERLELNRMCWESGVPLVEAAMDGAWGYVTVLAPGRTACLSCLAGDGDPSWAPLGFPVLGVAAGTIGCLAAAEAIKLVSGWGRPLEGSMLTIDLYDMSTSRLTLAAEPACPVCGGTVPDRRPWRPGELARQND